MSKKKKLIKILYFLDVGNVEHRIYYIYYFFIGKWLGQQKSLRTAALISNVIFFFNF